MIVSLEIVEIVEIFIFRIETTVGIVWDKKEQINKSTIARGETIGP